jgi:hypothetical protein
LKGISLAREASSDQDKTDPQVPGNELNFTEGNRIVGIPHGADKIRSYHPTSLFIDEAAIIPDAGQSFDEAIAACQKIAVLSSTNTGWLESVVVSAE